MPDSRHLLLEIANCPVVTDIRSGNVTNHCCRTIVSSQKQLTFQLPEPWVGQIDRAPILFISSNPSFDEEECFPDSNEEKWPPERIVDFFQNRFTSPAGWVKDLGVLHCDGSYSDWVRFWAAARARAAQILKKSKDAVVPGIDFALTEVVHCKSKKETGVSQALDFCTQLYLARVVQLASEAKIIVVYGSIAREVICRWPAVSGLEAGKTRIIGPSLLFGVCRILAFLPAPAAFGGAKSFNEAELAILHKHLRREPKEGCEE